MRETYTLESVVAGVLKVRGIHVVDFRHVSLSLLELFLVGQDGEGAEGARGGLRRGRRGGRAVGS